MDFSALNPRSTNALNLAARNNDVPNLRRLLKKMNPNCVDNRGWTCLHEAAFNDSLDCLKIILKNRTCRPLVESHEGHTALYVACQNTFSTRCIEYLLENVEDIANYGSREGFTPLHLVSRQGRTDAIQLLIDHGAIIDVVDFDGDTPLHEACTGRQAEAVNILLHAGACANVTNGHRVTPLHMACSRGCLEAVQYLYPFITDINVLDYNRDTPLIAACHGENVDLIQFLLEHGSDPYKQNYQLKTAICIALEKGLVEGFKMIFQAVNKDKLQLNLLYAAMSTSYLNLEIMDTILTSDLDPEFFMQNESWLSEPRDREDIQPQDQVFVRPYKKFAPLITFLNVAEYIYKMSVEKFDEYLYLYLMKGMSVNAVHYDEMPPLVWLHYCPHSTCFEHVLHLLVRLGCNVDYCSEIYSNFNKLENLLEQDSPSIIVRHTNQLDYIKRNNFPDVIYSSLLIDPATLPLLIRYSLQCDPGYILKSAYEFGIIDRLSTTAIIQLMKMIDNACEVTNYEGFKLYLPPLKHLCRLKVRYAMKRKDGTFMTTQNFLDSLINLPIPDQMKKYIRFM